MERKIREFGRIYGCQSFTRYGRKKIKDTWNSSDVIRNGKHYKKPHYHVIYIARNPVTIESVRNKIKRKLGNSSVAHVEILDYIKGSYEYLTHESKDAIAKNKHIYDKKDILNINDFDIDRYITLDESQKRELKNLLLDIVDDYNLVNTKDLMAFIRLRGAEFGILNTNDVKILFQQTLAPLDYGLRAIISVDIEQVMQRFLMLKRGNKMTNKEKELFAENEELKKRN